MAAITTLLLGKSLLFLTFWAATIHFSAIQVILKKQTAAVALTRSWFNRSSTAGDWTFENSFTVTAPIFSLEGFLAFLTSLNGHCLLQYYYL